MIMSKQETARHLAEIESAIREMRSLRRRWERAKDSSRMVHATLDWSFEVVVVRFEDQPC
jgi:hypothetical protein